MEKLRASLEQQFRETTGLGFKEFSCDLETGKQPPREVSCTATDEEDDQFFYRIIADEGDGDATVTASQPVEQLNPQGLATLRRPCEAFLTAFDRRAWKDTLDPLTEELRVRFSQEEDIGKVLSGIRESFGTIHSSQARTYGAPGPGLHQLEYDISTSAGDGVARFRLQLEGENDARIVAFLVTAKPDSALQTKLLTSLAKDILTGFLGQQVQSFAGPLSEVKVVGDVVEANAILADGSTIAVRVEQRGSAHDLDQNDYRFQVLDLPFLIKRYLTSTGKPPRSVDCPSRTAPDGGQVSCVATFPDGSTATVLIARRGGEHRIRPPQSDD